MATIEVIFSPPLAQPKPTTHPYLPRANPTSGPSNFHDRRDAR